MGQKVHPKGLRIGITKDWDTKWYADKRHFSELLVEDVKIREFVKKALFTSGVSRIELERIVTGNTQRVKVTVHTAKPGMVIGRQGAGITDLQNHLEKLTGKSVAVNVVEIRNPEVDATIVAESIAQQLEKRVSFRRAVKQSMQRAMRQGAKGIRVRVSGRIGGAEIARTEGDKDGTVPLHTLRADIDYGTAEANTTAGKVGVKVWLFAGDAANHAPKGNDRDDRRGGRGGERGGRGGERGGRGGQGQRGPGGPGGPGRPTSPGMPVRKGGRVDAGA